MYLLYNLVYGLLLLLSYSTQVWVLCYNIVYLVTKLDFNTLIIRCYNFSKVVFLTGVILLCPKLTIVNLNLKIDYRLVGDKIMFSLTTYLKVKG